MELRGRSCHVLNVHARTEDEIDDMDSFYEKLERVFDKFSKYHTKILLGDFNAKIIRKDIFKPTIVNESIHEFNNDNGIRVSKYCYIQKSVKVQYPHVITFINLLGHLLKERLPIKLIIF
jgi:hypothetical protein